MFTLTVVAGLLSAIQVSGETECPTAASVQHALVELAPGAEAASQRRATLKAAEGALTLAFLDAEGHTLGERLLPAAGTCEQRAEAAAVILVAWSGELPAAELEGPALPSRSGGEASASALQLELGLGPSVGLVGGAVPGVAAGALLRPRESRVAARMRLSVLVARRVPVGAGHAVWQRQWLGAGVAWLYAVGRWRFELFGEAGAALLSVAGEGFTVDRSALDVDPGLGGGVRLSVRLANIRPFLELSALGWPRPQTLQVTGAVPWMKDLPTGELFLTGGLAFEVL